LALGVLLVPRAWLAAIQRCRKLACLSQISGRQVSDVSFDVPLSPTSTIAAWSGEAAIHQGFSLAARQARPSSRLAPQMVVRSLVKIKRISTLFLTPSATLERLANVPRQQRFTHVDTATPTARAGSWSSLGQ
jgi:hypothetical protein